MENSFKITDMVMCINFLSSSQVYSLKTVDEVINTFKKEDVKGILNTLNTEKYYATDFGKYKIPKDDQQVMSFIKACNSENIIFANSSREPLSYVSSIMKDVTRYLTYNEGGVAV